MECDTWISEGNITKRCIGHHHSITPLLNANNKTLALIEIKTGRTHQIRVQCSIHNRPLVGDIKYNKKTEYKTYFLSALSLTFNEKSDILKNRTFTLPLNCNSHTLINNLFSKDEITQAVTLIEGELKY